MDPYRDDLPGRVSELETRFTFLQDEVSKKAKIKPISSAIAKKISNFRFDTDVVFGLATSVAVGVLGVGVCCICIGITMLIE